ncbi:MAG TPA: MFS transporter [Herpetosiphonaceae bacterium]|nr:MFS transporter [Herpetosiphonaceae bacterium]
MAEPRGVTAPAHRKLLGMPVPLRRVAFRRLWVGMSTSYAGNRLQQLAQGWLVATVTGSAVGVGLITALGSIPLLLLPFGGVIAEQVDRRRLLLAGQIVGAATTLAIAGLVFSQQIAVWHIYAWAFVNGVITLVARPAYKVVLTEAVPAEEVRAAVALNSMTETASLVAVNAGGSMLMGVLGLPVAFVLNTASYLVAAATLWAVPGSGALPAGSSGSLRVGSILADLRDGLDYLRATPALLQPLLLTFALILVTGPVLGLLPAIVQARGGTIVELGMLSASVSVGSLGGAIFAGAREPGARPISAYALFGLGAAVAVALFALAPTGIVAVLTLGTIGFVAFAEAVWNTSRIRQVASPAFQARLQALTSMAFTFGFALGTLWAGLALDQWGIIALLGGAAALTLCSLAILARHARTPA